MAFTLCVNFGLGTGLLHIFITFVLSIIENSAVDILKMTLELESRQKQLDFMLCMAMLGVCVSLKVV